MAPFSFLRLRQGALRAFPDQRQGANRLNSQMLVRLPSFGDDHPLPVAEECVLAHLEHEAAECSANNPNSALAAKIRLAWGLAHSGKGQADYRRAKRMTADLLKTAEDSLAIKELLYLSAVAHLNCGELVGAHHHVSQLLERCPHSSQGLDLKNRINEEMVRKGLTAVGLLVGAVTVGATFITRLAAKR